MIGFAILISGLFSFWKYKLKSSREPVLKKPEDAELWAEMMQGSEQRRCRFEDTDYTSTINK